MINAAAIIAKITIFIVEKSVGQIISLPIDKRRKACRSLTKLYYSIQSLDDTTEFFLETFKDFQDRGEASAFISSVAAHSRDITLSSNVFIELGQELIGGLEIIDPVLANCCHTLYVGKFDFLTYISKSIEWDRVLPRFHGRFEKV